MKKLLALLVVASLLVTGICAVLPSSATTLPTEGMYFHYYGEIVGDQVKVTIDLGNNSAPGLIGIGLSVKYNHEALSLKMKESDRSFTESLEPGSVVTGSSKDNLDSCIYMDLENNPSYAKLIYDSEDYYNPNQKNGNIAVITFDIVDANKDFGLEALIDPDEVLYIDMNTGDPVYVPFTVVSELPTNTPTTTAPITTDTDPVVTDPITTDTDPITTDTDPVTTVTAPITTDTDPVTTEGEEIVLPTEGLYTLFTSKVIDGKLHVYLDLGNNPGIWGYKVSLDYNAEALTFVEVKNSGEVFTDGEYSSWDTTKPAPKPLFYFAMLNDPNVNNNNNGRLGEFIFDIKDDSLSYGFVATYDPYDINDKDFNYIEMQLLNYANNFEPVVTTAPVTTAPVTTAPVTTAPVTTAPVTTAPVTTAPVTTAPVETTPVETTPVTTGPVVDTDHLDSLMVQIKAIPNPDKMTADDYEVAVAVIDEIMALNPAEQEYIKANYDMNLLTKAFVKVVIYQASQSDAVNIPAKGTYPELDSMMAEISTWTSYADMTMDQKIEMLKLATKLGMTSKEAPTEEQSMMNMYFAYYYFDEFYTFSIAYSDYLASGDIIDISGEETTAPETTAPADTTAPAPITTDAATTKPADTNKPQTGDNMLVIAIVAVAALAVCATIVIIRKKKITSDK